MSSSPGLPSQQATTTLHLQQNKQQNHQNYNLQQSQQHQNNRLQKQKQHQKLQHHHPPLSTVSPSKSPRNNGGGDSEAETVVLQSIEVAPNTRKNDDDISEYERGRRRRGSEARPPVDQERPRRAKPRPTKRRKEEDNDDAYSSDLSTPSRSSRPNSPSHPMRRRPKHGTGLQKPKLHDSSASEGDNSDREDARHSRLRSRKRRRSLMDSPPPNHRIKSSPPNSPQPLGSPIKSTRIREKAHAGQRTLKHRRALPAPVLTNRGNMSSSSSRENSPSSVARPRRPQSVRTPGSPMSNSHKPKRDTAGRTHLHRACQRGDVAEVEAILNSGTEFLNAEDNAGYQPLHEACLHGHLEVAKILIGRGAQIDQPSKIEQDTPLLDAVDNGHTEVVRYLLELGANPRKRNKQGQTALDANESNRETSEVYTEIEGLLKAAISELRKQRPSDDETARASVAADSHSSRDPSVASPVHQSPPAPSIPSGARRRNARTEQSRKDLLWLDAGKNGLQKLREMAREGDQQMVGALLERGTKPDTESLIGAIKGGHADTVSLLLAYGNIEVDPEPGSSQGHRKTRDNSMPVGEETPMLAAIGRGNLDILGYLLDNGVNPRRLDHRGKSYMDIARDREGDFWQEEVELLQRAYDNAGDGGKPERVTRRGRSPENYRNTSPKPKRLNDTKATSSGSRRSNSTLASANTPRRSASTGPSRWASTSANPIRYEDTNAVSDQEEISAEPLGPPKNRSKKGKRSESDSIAPPIAKKKRRLISGKDLAHEESLVRLSQEPTRSAPPESDVDSKEKPSTKSSNKKQRANSSMEETIRVEQKPIIPRKLRMGSEDTRMSDSATERTTNKARNDDSNLLRPDNIPSSKDKKPTMGGKRDRTRSPTAHSDSGRKQEKEEPRKQRKLVDKQEKYDSDSTLKRVVVKEEGKSRKPPSIRRDSPDGRRQSISTTEASEKEDQRQRVLWEREETERNDRREREKRQRARGEKEDVRRREESKERRRQEALRKELESILEKARQESMVAREDQIIHRELEFRRQREERERQERELREKEEREQEEREAREKEMRDREEVAREIARRQAAEREAKEREEREIREREAREREMREREARDREAREREAEQKRREEQIRIEEQRRQAEETRKLEEAIRRVEQELLQKKLAEEQRLKEEAEKQRLEAAAAEQRRAAEAERKRVEEEVRKRQELERAEKEAVSRREAEQLQQQLEAERKRALPFALRQVEESVGTPLESSRFMPLYSAIIDPPQTANSTPTKTGMNGCSPQKPPQYILNVQAALVLGSTDLQFSSHPDIHKHEVDDQQRLRMWSVLSVMLCESVHLSDGRSIEELEKSRREEREKFLKMSPVFWMKVDDLRTIIHENRRYANLASQTIRTVDVDLSCPSTSAAPVKINGDGPTTPLSATAIKKEEMARRLQRLFGTSPSLQYSNQSHVSSSPLSSQLTVSMPPPTPFNATNAASTPSN